MFVFLLSLLVTVVYGGTVAEWRQRTIYQLLTDRFNRGNGDNSACSDVHTYCGGTFKGIKDQLNYITGMGFDAIWISPIVANTAGGYHGYWAEDFYSINPNFGTQQDLIDLVSACHSQGVWVMLDAVGNHVGPVGYDYSSVVPFNQASHYHDCNNCPSDCNINFNSGNQQEVELCRLAGLPDLNQSSPYVATTLQNWIHNIISTYNFDGVRIDTVPEVNKNFWYQYTSAAGVFTIGEVFDGRVDYVSGYQGYVDATLSYPLYFTLTNVFGHKYSMNNIQSTLQQYNQLFKDVSVLGTFFENHDNARFGSFQSDQALFKSGVTFILMAQGIPIFYYGGEQGFNGGNDPYNREPLWTTNFNTNSELYNFVKSVVSFRKTHNIQALDQVQRYSDDTFYAFTRGSAAFVATTNVGSSGGVLSRSITYHPFADGQKLCNYFYPTSDCLTVENGKFEVYLANGESKIYYPV